VEFAFYSAAAIAIAATLGVITGKNPVHALLYMIVSLLAVAMIFFVVGAPFAGALEVIVYAGAIMVLFVFVVMMLNLGAHTIAQEKQWLKPGAWTGPGLLAFMLLIVLCYSLFRPGHPILSAEGLAQRASDYPLLPAPPVQDSVKIVGIALYGPYLLAVELASMLLLGALVTAYHLGRNTEKD